MKKVITILAVFLSCRSFAQLKELTPSKTIKIGSFYDIVGNASADLNCLISDGDTLYTIIYKNQKYTTITDIQHIAFKSDNGEIGQLYKILKDSFSSVNKENKDFKKEFQLGDAHVILSRHSGMKNWIDVWTNSGYFYMKEKHVDMLFGKLVKVSE